MNKLVLLGIIFVVLLLNSCNTPSVESSKPKVVYIASDFLATKDSVLFKDFSKKEQIKVVILAMSADSIIQHYTTYKYNSKFDIVLLKTTFGMYNVSQIGALHPIPETHRWQDNNFVSPTNDWITLGIDPYIVTGLKEKKAFQYNDLTWGLKWKNNLSNDEMAAFRTSVMLQFGRKNFNKSLKWLKNVEHQTANEKDTLIASFELTRLSKLTAKQLDYVYPSQIVRLGAFYDGVNVGIVRHSSKFTTALNFLSFYTKSQNNQKICKRLNLLPVTHPHNVSPFAYQNNYPILFRCSPRKSVPMLRNLKKIEARLK
ncbi:MAG: hypothetical protein M9916_09200 [Crocinitomicaceae bacterium]|nr:hypothetical protein [Crocinitomicaceae bacterium]